jgi:two-component system OmpR family response regulator
MMRVLVADDTKNIRSLLTKCLQMEGYRVQMAVDGQEAAEMFARERFDLAFLDIKMPLLSGTEVLKRIREQGVNTPVVIITAYATIKNAVECTNLGAVAYLQKPFTAEKIRAVLKEALNFDAGKSRLENILRLADSKIAAEHYGEAERILKNSLPEYSLEAEIYRLLTQALAAQKKQAEAEQYDRIYQTLTRGRGC